MVRARHGDDPYRVHAIVITILFIVTIPGLMALMAAIRPAPPGDELVAEAQRLGVRVDDLHRGKSIYARTCAACHGQDGNGVPAVGKPLRNSAFVQSHADGELLALVITGRLPHDPLNTTGIPMPPRAAQNLSDDQIEAVVVYLRTLQDPNAPVADLHPWIRKPLTRPATPPAPEPEVARVTAVGDSSRPPAEGAADASAADAPAATAPTAAAFARGARHVRGRVLLVPRSERGRATEPRQGARLERVRRQPDGRRAHRVHQDRPAALGRREHDRDRHAAQGRKPRPKRRRSATHRDLHPLPSGRLLNPWRPNDARSRYVPEE